MTFLSRLFSIVVLLALGQIAYAADADLRRLFRKLDTDHDHSLRADEVQTAHTRLFARLLRIGDADGDEALSIAEFNDALAPVRPVKPLAEKVGNGLPGGDALLLLLVNMDANGDRTVEAEEVPPRYRPFFDRVEELIGGEPDGRLDGPDLTRAAPRLTRAARQEVERLDIDVELELALLPEKKWTLLQKMRGPYRPGDALADPKRALALFRRIDANGDGQVTLDEAPPAAADRLERLLRLADRNHDQQLSEAELLAFSRQIKFREANQLPQAEIDRGVKRILRQFDRNNDRRISRKEAPGRMIRRFGDLDHNGDGQLDRAELARVVEALGRQRQANDAPRMPQPSMDGPAKE